MTTAARVRALRIRAGKSQTEMAERLGLNVAWYADLERKDDQLAQTLTLFKAMELASLLGVTVHELLDQPAVAQRIAILELPDRILDYARDAGISIEKLEENLGSDLSDFLASPLQSASELPILFFQKLATVLRLNWLALIPDESND
jgi:transcriptional regulator with XRE-family HTH domain